MSSINWLVRIKNKNFWLALIPAVLLLVQAVAALFGFELDLGTVGEQLQGVVNSLFVVLALVGIVNDPTTKGLKDSDRAMAKTEAD